MLTATQRALTKPCKRVHPFVSNARFISPFEMMISAFLCRLRDAKVSPDSLTIFVHFLLIVPHQTVTCAKNIRYSVNRGRDRLKMPGPDNGPVSAPVAVTANLPATGIREKMNEKEMNGGRTNPAVLSHNGCVCLQ